jgi:hypothetical protein
MSARTRRTFGPRYHFVSHIAQESTVHGSRLQDWSKDDRVAEVDGEKEAESRQSNSQPRLKCAAAERCTVDERLTHVLLAREVEDVPLAYVLEQHRKQ